MADDVALRRIESAGITLTSTNQVLAELARDWETPKGRIIIKIMYRRDPRQINETVNVGADK